jgi:hypothetical protein
VFSIQFQFWAAAQAAGLIPFQVTAPSYSTLPARKNGENAKEGHRTAARLEAASLECTAAVRCPPFRVSVFHEQRRIDRVRTLGTENCMLRVQYQDLLYSAFGITLNPNACYDAWAL